MKKIMFMLLAVGLFQLLLPEQINAQSCCAAKAACLKTTGNVSKEKQDDTKCMTSTTTREVKNVAPLALASASSVISAFAINRLGEMVTKLAHDPCCVAKGCEPAKCDVSACEPSKCIPNK